VGKKNFGEHFQVVENSGTYTLRIVSKESRFIIKVMEFIKEITMTGVGNSS